VRLGSTLFNAFTANGVGVRARLDVAGIGAEPLLVEHHENVSPVSSPWNRCPTMGSPWR
jgi:hypothetical protein